MIELVNESEPFVGERATQNLQVIYPFSFPKS